MGRWEPDARGRLEQAALELYAEQGFEATTVAQIAERAGLTERTFFRYFGDKREVLFWGAGELREALESAVREAPTGLAAMASAIMALERVADVVFEARRERVWQRQAIVSANNELQERELIKLAGLSATLASALQERGFASTEARLAAEAGIVVLKAAFERWLSVRAGEHSLADLIGSTAAELRAVASA